jgi:REP element-mobilizing transposase RayT
LFEPRFKRILISSKDYFINASIYIHLNPVKHGFVQNPEDMNFNIKIQIEYS